MCLAMNSDKLGSDKDGAPRHFPDTSKTLPRHLLGSGERCASTSNRNFEGRQGAGGRTHLMSPIMAAAAATTGRLADTS